MNAQALRIAGFSGILAIAALRAMVTIQAQVWFDVDPAVDPMPLLSLACAWSHGLDALLLIASGVALIGEQKSGRGLHHTLIALAFLPPGTAEGAAVTLDVRGSLLAGRVVPLPFVAKH